MKKWIKMLDLMLQVFLGIFLGTGVWYVWNGDRGHSTVCFILAGVFLLILRNFKTERNEAEYLKYIQ